VHRCSSIVFSHESTRDGGSSITADVVARTGKTEKAKNSPSALRWY
jgi:hypothetical protein